MPHQSNSMPSSRGRHSRRLTIQIYIVEAHSGRHSGIRRTPNLGWPVEKGCCDAGYGKSIRSRIAASWRSRVTMVFQPSPVRTRSRRLSARIPSLDWRAHPRDSRRRFLPLPHRAMPDRSPGFHCQNAAAFETDRSLLVIAFAADCQSPLVFVNTNRQKTAGGKVDRGFCRTGHTLWKPTASVVQAESVWSVL
jgi:hypothetical protein